MVQNDVKTGHCLCGAVGFKTKGTLRDVVACHCSQCRRQSGLYFAATNVANADLEVTGEDNVRWYSASEHGERGFCQTCGSALFWRFAGEAHRSVLAGAFDEPTGLKLSHHIFCADKGDFYEITDGLPQYPAGKPL